MCYYWSINKTSKSIPYIYLQKQANPDKWPVPTTKEAAL